MDSSTAGYEKLIRSAARRLKGHARRLFQAEVADTLCHSSPRAAERRFGFDRKAVATGQHEAQSGIRCVERFAARARPCAEVKDPQLGQDIRALVEPHLWRARRAAMRSRRMPGRKQPRTSSCTRFSKYGTSRPT